MKLFSKVSVLGLAVLFVLGMSGAALAGSIVIKGSTTVLPLAQRAAEEFLKQHPDVSISVSGGGSGNGIKALLDGSTDIADASRYVKDKEIDMAKGKGIEFVAHVVALDCVVPVVHPSNNITNLTLDQLKDIYTGKIVNWKEVGGADKPIVIISRDTSSGTYEVWYKLVLRKKKVTPRALLQASNGAVAQAVANNKYAIGYVGIGYLNDDLKGLTVNGIKATVASARDGSFPVSRELYMFTNGEPTGDTKAFLDFVKSAEGQKIAEQEGFVALELK